MPTIIYAKDFIELPWKNGKGVTREIFRVPHETNPDLFNFRLSVAAVSESASFSIYPGIDRFLMLLEGGGFRLKFDDQADAVLASPFDSVSFEGEEVIHCELLSSKSLDFNVMTNRSWGSSVVSTSILKAGGAKIFSAKNDTYVFVYGAEPMLVVLKPGEEHELDASVNLVIIEVVVTKRPLQ